MTTNLDCFNGRGNIFNPPGRQYGTDSGVPTESCYYIDPNPLGSLNDLGHNYFLSRNPYVLNSYAGFGEAYYNVTARSETHGRLALDGRSEAFPRYPESNF